MILSLIALLAVSVIGVWGAVKGSRTSFFCGFISPVLGGFGLIGLLVYGILVLGYIGSKHQADIINREYGTSYTQEEVFYASNVIDTIREIDRKRVELNGNLITGDK